MKEILCGTPTEDSFSVRSWKKWEASSVQYKIKSDSNYSFYMGIEDADCILLDYTVTVQPNTCYIVTAECKTKGVVDKENAEQPFGASISTSRYVHSIGLVGDNEWTTLRTIGRSDENGKLCISLGLGFFGHVCTGEAWFEEVRYIPADDFVAEDRTWRFLGIVLATTAFQKEDGSASLHRMSNEEINAAKKTLLQVPKDITADTGGALQAKMDVIVSYGLFDKFQNGDQFGYAMSHAAAYEYCRKNRIDITEYDHVAFVMCQPDMPHNYFGLGGCFIDGYAGHTSVLYHDPQPLIDSAKPEALWTPGIYVHEFLHAAESYSDVLGYPRGVLHHGAEYGYSDADGWRAYYKDYMLNWVLHEGKHVGIHPTVWKIPPHVFRQKSYSHILFEK